MLNIFNAEHEYQIREKRYSEQFNKESRQYNILSNLRVVAFLGIIFGAILFYYEYRISGSLFSICALVTFVIFIVQHEKVKNRKELAFSLARINRQAIDRINGKWVEFTDNGEEFFDQKHQYSVDLDIFGQASLFQWINNTVTFLGKKFLKNALTEPETDILKIKERQAAINELAGKLDWRQHFWVEGGSIKNGTNNPEALFEWAENENHIFRLPWLIWVIRLISLATVVSLLLPFLKDISFLYITAILLLTQLILFIIGLRFYLNSYEVIDRHKDAILAFQKLLTRIERENFESKYLSELKSSLIDSSGNYASKQINELSLIVDMMSFKHSPLIYFILNVIFLFDYNCMIELERWKKKSGCSLRTWLTVIGKFDEISSLTTIRYDNPNWCIPGLTNSKNNLYAKNMGHPLLFSNARVCNDLNIKGSGNVLLITGSNMSGKSTLLRTVGLNLVLAYTGAPVCASDFKCSIMDIYTSMRVNDNLEKKISSFYAELLRIRTIIQAASRNNSILFLLDEIFKGTNSKDRHIGAAAVIRKLSKMKTVGLVSTHDLELGELEIDKDIDVENYHFSENYLNNQIVFDYKLYSGVSKTTNAIYLMKMVGIDEL
ncbi:DNA mismatch repair protein MutS domain protein [Desulfofarcimen acetoxidans DSM 771]|uniref:DNA mismatch repair protein MutS domain protein n=1 Tax=Desulfofarcimen acetoxidans (strain ATCC 49208 / DSM 771 / KCTC 5769 / VKM B-1644 / 5575) TaxID=485916 RepID=C8W4D2_DESAS|nr:MutS family DNA mismatch repair protein [Desulfofarcimen acetoxidans]ACV62000.1 DNA mismatch repair protein MutS domain protein [Desulfofarcimen acetoxidans DSM 771]